MLNRSTPRRLRRSYSPKGSYSSLRLPPRAAPLLGRPVSDMAPKKGKKSEPAAAAAQPPAAAGGPEVEAEDVEETAGGSKEQQREGGDVAKLTDYVEQREIDSARATQAVASILEGSQTAAEREAEIARERELAAVQVDAADVALIVQELELESSMAERKLREHNGDVVECLHALVSE